MKFIFYFIFSFYFLCFNFVKADGFSSEGGSIVGSLVMFGVLFVLMYFLMIRPQTKRTKEHKELILKLVKGDEIITSSGFLGKIIKVTDQFVVLLISSDVEVIIQKQSVVSIVPKGTLKSVN